MTTRDKMLCFGVALFGIGVAPWTVRGLYVIALALPHATWKDASVVCIVVGLVTALVSLEPEGGDGCGF